MSAIYISDEQATKDIAELKNKISQLIDDYDNNKISYSDIKEEYGRLKDKVREMHRVYHLKNTTGGEIYSKYAKWILGHINAFSFTSKCNAPANKIISALEDAKSEIRYHNL